MKTIKFITYLSVELLKEIGKFALVFVAIIVLPILLIIDIFVTPIQWFMDVYKNFNEKENQSG